MARAYRTLLLIFAAAACAVSGGCRGATASVGEAKPPKVTVSHPTYERITDEESYTGWLRASAKVEVRRGFADTSKRSISATEISSSGGSCSLSLIPGHSRPRSTRRVPKPTRSRHKGVAPKRR